VPRRHGRNDPAVTDNQKATLCRALADIATLREQCEPADRVDLTVLLVEGMALVLRPHNPEPTGSHDDCIR